MARIQLPQRYRLKHYPVSLSILRNLFMQVYADTYGVQYVAQPYDAVLDDLLRYVAGQDNNTFPLNKGFYLWGKRGIGKSTLVRALSLLVAHAMCANKWTPLSCTKLAMSVTTEQFTLETFNQRVVYYDDLGNEQLRVKYYGNDIIPMLEVVLMRYDTYQELGHFTHFTSNYDLQWVGEHYGVRMADRLQEMCTVVHLEGSNLRIMGK